MVLRELDTQFLFGCTSVHGNTESPSEPIRLQQRKLVLSWNKCQQRNRHHQPRNCHGTFIHEKYTWNLCGRTQKEMECDALCNTRFHGNCWNKCRVDGSLCHGISCRPTKNEERGWTMVREGSQVPTAHRYVRTSYSLL